MKLFWFCLFNFVVAFITCTVIDMSNNAEIALTINTLISGFCAAISFVFYMAVWTE